MRVHTRGPDPSAWLLIALAWRMPIRIRLSDDAWCDLSGLSILWHPPRGGGGVSCGLGMPLLGTCLRMPVHRHDEHTLLLQVQSSPMPGATDGAAFARCMLGLVAVLLRLASFKQSKLCGCNARGVQNAVEA